MAYYVSKHGLNSTRSSEVLSEAAALGLAGQVRTLARQRTGGFVAASGSIGTAAIMSNLVNVTQVPQQKSYYCGPAVGYMIIKSPRFNGKTSAANGAALSQAAMASSTHMKTDANLVTSWASKNFVLGLNKWIGSSKAYVQLNAPGVASFKAVATSSIDNGYPYAVDTVEFINGAHYNNHPNRTIGHWLAGYYYSSYGDSVSFADSTSGSGLSGYGSAQPKFAATTATFVSTYLQSNGVAY